MMRSIIITLCCYISVNLFAQVNLDSSSLPIVIITTPNAEPIPDEPKITADMAIIDNGPGQMNDVDDPPNDYDGKIGIELRGSTSQDLYPKKQFALETRDELGENNNVSLLGLPKENDWILHAPYSDKTLIRNALAYKLAGQIMPYAPRYRFCEVIVNDEYQGVYLLLEKIKRDNDRVDISRLDPDENAGDALTGGYILKLDKWNGSDNDGFPSDYPPQPGAIQQTIFQYHYPKPEDISNPQKAYIQEFMHEFDDVMASDNFADSTTGYHQYIDALTFVDYMIVNEICKNVDAYRLSTYFYKDRDSIDGRLKMGPVWDFNLGFGNVDFCMGPSPTEWVLNYSNYCPADNWIIHFWWEKLRFEEGFRALARERYFSLREDLFSNQKIWACIDSLVNHLDDARERNFEQWPIHGEYVWPNAYVGGNYDDDLNYLKKLAGRSIWNGWTGSLVSSIKSPIILLNILTRRFTPTLPRVVFILTFMFMITKKLRSKCSMPQEG